jgi:hypothetical protein
MSASYAVQVSICSIHIRCLISCQRPSTVALRAFRQSRGSLEELQKKALMSAYVKPVRNSLYEIPQHLHISLLPFQSLTSYSIGILLEQSKRKLHAETEKLKREPKQKTGNLHLRPT